MNLVVVESPAKAKTIEKYLGSEYKVIASMGHIVQLPSKNDSVDIEAGFNMKYEITDRAKPNVKRIVDLAKKSNIVFLASDPDREGEAISFNVATVLKDKKAVTQSQLKRVTFTEITKKAVTHAIQNPRDLDMNLIDAQQARLALDYLVGFNLSPILWRKLPGSKSAGRVQSVALRLLAEREIEIKAFVPNEYWSLDIALNAGGAPLVTNATKFEKKKFDNTFPSKEEEVRKIEGIVKNHGKMVVSKIDKKDIKQNATPPFTTALLQQEASRKLGFSSKRTMQVAQKLYESGNITYMRTDGMSIGEDALKAIRDYISGQFGDKYLPTSPVRYKTKAKNAQEAHEAIRPTNVTKNPEAVRAATDADGYKLYKMIWNRTIACQMMPAIKTVESLEFATPCEKVSSRVSISKIKFDGFLRVYGNQDNIEASDNDVVDGSSLPPLKIGEEVPVSNTKAAQHFTSPPPRYSEASLIKSMEELGIGRPSTYSSIISILQDREYVRLDARRFFANPRGMMVFGLLKHFLPKYVEYDFTAKLEHDLDLISDGKANRVEFLNSFWFPFIDNVKATGALSSVDIVGGLNKELHEYFLPKNTDKSDACPKCDDGKLQINIGKYGAYFSCSSYPKCDFRQNLEKAQLADDMQGGEFEGEPKIEHEGMMYEVKTGPYGTYVEVTSASEDAEDVEKASIKKSAKAPKPKRVGLPKGVEITRDIIIKYGNLPRNIGNNGTTGDILVNTGKYGPYLSCDGKNFTIKPNMLFEISIEEAIAVMEAKKSGTGGSRFGKGSSSGGTGGIMFKYTDGGDIKVGKGRFGVYAMYKSKYYTLKGLQDASEATEEMVIEAITTKLEKEASGGAVKKPASKKPAAKKPAAKKAIAKKPVVKKTTVKKPAVKK